jgi:hypothetical protein
MSMTKKFTFVVLALIVMFSGLGLSAPLGGDTPSASEEASVRIVKAAEGQSISIEARLLPTWEKFYVLIGPAGSKGIGGWQIGTFSTGQSGSVNATFPISFDLRRGSSFDLRVQNHSNTFAVYTSFGFDPNPNDDDDGSLGISVASVEPHEEVTVVLYNLPAHTTVNIMIRAPWRIRKTMYIVDTLDTGKGGTKQITVAIPARLRYVSQLYIIVQDKETGKYAYAEFVND